MGNQASHMAGYLLFDVLDNAQCVMLKAILTDLIDKDVDSLRFYYLGNRYQTKIEHVGVDRGIPADQTLIL